MKNLNKRGLNIDLWGTHRIISSHSLMIIHFVAKLSWKENFFKKKSLCFLQNIHYLQKKMFLYGKKSFILKIFFNEKKTFFTEKNINENVKNI